MGTIKFLNFRTPKIFAVSYLKFKQRGQTLGYFVKMVQREYQTVTTLIRLLLLKEQSDLGLHCLPRPTYLNFCTPKIFAVSYLKFKQRGQTLGYFVIMVQREYQTVKTLIRLLLLKEQSDLGLTVCPDLSVRKLRVITVYFSAIFSLRLQ